MNENASGDDAKLHRRFAAQFFNDTWALIEKPNRSPDDDARMIHLAHASRMHWEFVGDAQNKAVGEWQIARVYSMLKMKEAAVYHARRCLALIEGAGITGFFLGSAHEGLARALRVAGDQSAEKHLAAARKILSELTDPEDKQTLEGDLASVPA